MGKVDPSNDIVDYVVDRFRQSYLFHKLSF